ncbi:MAG: hypothetical protein EAZ21_10625 [Betaproteobacteria bacterium]|nr:MAG: hypothetical protein EAZ21_10625 [Betaproteobacteria bacterium]
MPEAERLTQADPAQAINTIGVRIAGLARLGGDDRLRAAALALRREFGIATDSISLVVIDLGYDERALIAYAANANGAMTLNFDAWFETLLKKRAVVWSMAAGDAESVVYSEHGATAISHWRDGEAPPSAMVALANERARSSQPLTVWLDCTRANDAVVPSPATLAHWNASLGAEFRMLEARPAANLLPLRRVPSLSSAAPTGVLDRALWAAALASIACLVIAGARTLVNAPPQATTARAIAAGELWARATLTSPVLAEQMKSATFGGGAWVIAVPGITPSDLDRAAKSLGNNGFTTQLVREPEARIRVQP